MKTSLVAVFCLLLIIASVTPHVFACGDEDTSRQGPPVLRVQRVHKVRRGQQELRVLRAQQVTQVQ